MKAVILAGGKGTRLAPYTNVLPKPLVPVGDCPILEIIIKQLIQNKFTEVTLMVGHLSELIKAYFIQRPSISNKIKIHYIGEETPTGTAGSLASLEGMEDTFLVMNGDILTTLNYTDIINFHDRNQNMLTIAMHKKQVKIDLGVLELNEADNITGYIEKPVMDYMVSMGIYIYNPKVLEFIKKGEYLDFPTLALNLVNQGYKVMGYNNNAKWLDIGRIEDFHKATEEFEKHKNLFLPND
jgi:NDP-sugar pyrophosphorylase family protein